MLYFQHKMDTAASLNDDNAMHTDTSTTDWNRKSALDLTMGFDLLRADIKNSDSTAREIPESAINT